MSSIEIADLVVQRLEHTDGQVFGLGDAFDVKASIGLVVITFLATQSAEFLKDSALSGFWHQFQWLSVMSLVAAGVLALLELWPRDYEVEPSQAWEEWAEELADHYKNDADADRKIKAALREGQLLRTRQRIERNTKVNDLKSKLLIWSFRCTALALLVNLATLMARAAR